MSPAVSVLIPTYDRLALLRETLDSVYAQSFLDLETIVIDHGSTDGTVEAVKALALPRLTVLPLEHRGTLSQLRNRGLTAAQGEFIAFLDSDDLWEREKLQRGVELLRAHPALGFVQSGYYTFDDTGIRSTDLQLRASLGSGQISMGDLFPLVIRAQVAMYTSTLIVRRIAIEATGGWDERLRAGDGEWMARVAFHHYGAILHQPLARIRKHPGNMSREHWEHDFEEAIVTIDQFFARGAITRDVYQEMSALYHGRFGECLLKHDRKGDAEREFRLCPAKFRTRT
jgi:glycosyltransferase involved in cell wall biosynthesis